MRPLDLGPTSRSGPRSSANSRKRPPGARSGKAALSKNDRSARAAFYKLPREHTAGYHASMLEGRMYLKGVITALKLLSREHYRRVFDRFARDTGRPAISVNPLAHYHPSEPQAIAAPASGAAKDRSNLDYDRAEEALNAAGIVNEVKASWAVSRVPSRDRASA